MITKIVGNLLAAALMIGPAALVADNSPGSTLVPPRHFSVVAMHNADDAGRCVLRPVHIIEGADGTHAFFTTTKSPLAKLAVGAQIPLAAFDSDDHDQWIDQVGTVLSNEVVDQKQGIIRVSLSIKTIHEQPSAPAAVLEYIAEHQGQ